MRDKDLISAARAKFRAAIVLAGSKSGPGQEAIGNLLAMQQEGMARLDEAARLHDEKQYLEALGLAEQTKTKFGSIFTGLRAARRYPSIATRAKKLIEEWKQEAAVAAVVQEREAAARLVKVERLEEKATKDPTKYYDVYKALGNIARRHPGCPTGQECAKRLAALEQDEKISKLIKKEKQRRSILAALRRIEEYERDGLTGQAEMERTKLAKDFPGKTLDELRRIADRKT